ncbi:nitroreductase family protein [Candidatus Woesearchaeota archaeon]|nr:nitroreductase family protein [Candidatus Woesearchaeota archaeon]
MRNSNYKINKIILDRWSPRAMSGEELNDDELMPLFEAARWAPSSYNNQSWRFIYAKRDSKHWNKFFNLLIEFNQQWCKNAAVLVLVISKKTFDHDGQLSITHSFDTGAACENLALEGCSRGLVVHGMQGFDYEKAKEIFEISDDYEIEAMIAIGKKGNEKNLPEGLKKGEVMSDRKPLNQIVFENIFDEK